MWYRLALIGALVGGAGVGAAGAADTKEGAPAEGSAKSTAGEKAGAIDPKAAEQLHKMSDYLAGLKTFRVDTNTVDESTVTKNGQKIQQLAESKMAIKRPGEMRIDRVGPNGTVVFRDDGNQFSVYNSEKNVYATKPAPGNLDEAADEAREELQVNAPGVDLLASNPYDALTDGLTEAHYIGLVPMGNGVMAHHLAATRKNGISYQIWIQDGAQPLPLRYVVTDKHARGAPQFTIELRNWQPNAQLPGDTFTFTPPAGAKKVAFAPPHKG
jgi:hypothetical protein